MLHKGSPEYRRFWIKVQIGGLKAAFLFLAVCAIVFTITAPFLSGYEAPEFMPAFLIFYACMVGAAFIGGWWTYRRESARVGTDPTDGGTGPAR